MTDMFLALKHFINNIYNNNLCSLPLSLLVLRNISNRKNIAQVSSFKASVLRALKTYYLCIWNNLAKRHMIPEYISSPVCFIIFVLDLFWTYGIQIQPNVKYDHLCIEIEFKEFSWTDVAISLTRHPNLYKSHNQNEHEIYI